jgi:hypothetical protein
VNILTDYSSKEQYKIQPEKSAVIDMGSTKTKGERSTNFKIHEVSKWVVVSLTVDDLCIPKSVSGLLYL